MLNPDARSLYTAALTPPPGYVLDQALAATYSLDPTTLLTVPVHLALLGRTSGAEMDGIAVLEALRRVTERTTIYSQCGLIQVPKATHLLFGLLESMVVEVRAPRGGVFHPKFWVLRFIEPDEPDFPLLRLLVLSRNLTADRSWDLSLQLEGRPTGRFIAANRSLGELLQLLPELAARDVPPGRREQANRLGEELRRTRWELPEGYDDVRFHVLGRGQGVWRPPASKQLAVVSPFVTAPALQALSETTRRLLAVVARPEELDSLPPEARDVAERWWVLDDAAETEDGEETEARDTIGLHAKAYLAQCGWYTHLFVGSANATSEALLADGNIELLAELVGKSSRVGGVEQLLGSDGLGPVLVQHSPPDQKPEVDEAECQAEAALEAARLALATVPLRVTCERTDAGCHLRLVPQGAIRLDGIETIRSWPLTVQQEHGADAAALATGSAVDLGRLAVASVTGLIAFELVASAAPCRLRFALNLPVDGLPDDRDAAILRTIIRNRDGFLRYLLLLLGDLSDYFHLEPGAATRGTSGAWGSGFSSDFPLLEELTRAYSRDPQRLREVQGVVDRLQASDAADVIIPAEFLELWRVFHSAMSGAGR